MLLTLAIGSMLFTYTISPLRTLLEECWGMADLDQLAGVVRTARLAALIHGVTAVVCPVEDFPAEKGLTGRDSTDFGRGLEIRCGHHWESGQWVYLLLDRSRNGHSHAADHTAQLIRRFPALSSGARVSWLGGAGDRQIRFERRGFGAKTNGSGRYCRGKHCIRFTVTHAGLMRVHD